MDQIFLKSEWTHANSFGVCCWLNQDACLKFKGRTRPAIWQRNLQDMRGSQPALQELTCTLYLILEGEQRRNALSQESARSSLHPPGRQRTRTASEGSNSRLRDCFQFLGVFVSMGEVKKIKAFSKVWETRSCLSKLVEHHEVKVFFTNKLPTPKG